MKIAQASAGKITYPIGEGDNQFAIVVRTPSYAERMSDCGIELSAMQKSAGMDDLLKHRMGFVVDWQGVEDSDGQPIPFSQKTLQAAAAADAQFAFLVIAKLNEHFTRRIDENAVKN
jgi:hypothetical protein